MSGLIKKRFSKIGGCSQALLRSNCLEGGKQGLLSYSDSQGKLILHRTPAKSL